MDDLRLINVYRIFLLTIYIIFMKKSDDPLYLILYPIFLSICGGLLVVIAVLAILNVKACLKYREELMAEPPVKMNLVMKFALISFFVMNFLFWMTVGIYAIFFWFRWSWWVVNIIFNIVTPFILFAEGLPAIMATILKGRKYNDDTYIKAAILHFFPLLEYLGAFILYLHKNNSRYLYRQRNELVLNCWTRQLSNRHSGQWRS